MYPTFYFFPPFCTMAEDKNSSEQPTSDEMKFNPLNPLFLGSHDGPRNVITPIIFRGNYYEEWSRSIRLSLMARRKYEFLEGKIIKPIDEKGFARLALCSSDACIMDT